MTLLGWYGLFPLPHTLNQSIKMRDSMSWLIIYPALWLVGRWSTCQKSMPWTAPMEVWQASRCKGSPLHVLLRRPFPSIRWVNKVCFLIICMTSLFYVYIFYGEYMNMGWSRDLLLDVFIFEEKRPLKLFGYLLHNLIVFSLLFLESILS